MYKQTIQLSSGEMLQLTWGKNYANFTVMLNGQFIGLIPDGNSLKLGGTFTLPGDGNRQILVILLDRGINIQLDGVEIFGGRHSDNAEQFAIAIGGLVGVSLLELVFVLIYFLVGLIVNTDSLFLVSLVWSVDAIVLCALALWARKVQSILPMVFALILQVVGLSFKPSIPFGWLLSLLAGYFLYKGIRAGPSRRSVVSKFGTDAPLDAGI